ncbi:hypothetical protein F4604DRAFT_1539648, partial [Suillus subluteus]
PPPQDPPLLSQSPPRHRDFSPPPPGFSPPPPDFAQPPQSLPPILPERIHEDTDAEFTDASERYYRTHHSMLNGRPCTAKGAFLPYGTPPTPVPPKSPVDWSPYRNRTEFEMAEFAFK